MAAIFIWAAAGKIMFYDINAQYMASKGLTMIPALLFGAAIVELLGGLSLILGYKTRLGAFILLLFLIPTTLIFHDFWNLEGVARIPEQVNFMKNLAIFGGLLYIVAHGAG
jgi:putative oxidoreductase